MLNVGLKNSDVTPTLIEERPMRPTTPEVSATEQLPVVPHALTFKIVYDAQKVEDKPFDPTKAVMIVAEDGSVYARYPSCLEPLSFWLFGTNSRYNFSQQTVPPTAKVYIFEHMVDISRFIRAGQCIDKYLWKKPEPVQSNTIQVSEIIKKLQVGAYIGCIHNDTKRHLTLDGNTIYFKDAYGNNKNTNSILYSTSINAFISYNNIIYIFNDQHKFFNWLNS